MQTHMLKLPKIASFTVPGNEFLKARGFFTKHEDILPTISINTSQVVNTKTCYLKPTSHGIQGVKKIIITE